MPNYIRNKLIVYGVSDELKYFYEHNRVTEDHMKYMNYDYITDLSFQKCVSHSIISVLHSYIQENYSVKRDTKLALLTNLDKNINIQDLMYNIWGTSSDALSATVNLEEINNGFISYKFSTEFGSPFNWLISVSQIFPKLRFQITYSDEYDNHEEIHVYEFKNGIKTEIESYNAVTRCIEENGGIESVVHMIIEYCNNNNIKINDYSNDVLKEMNWIMYCKKFIEENKDTDGYENDLVSDLLGHIDDFLDKKKLHHSLYTDTDLCILFLEKIQNMN